MTRERYLEALTKLGLKPYGKGTALIVGLSMRQMANIAAGHSKVPGPVAQLLTVLEQDGRQAVEPQHTQDIP